MDDEFLREWLKEHLLVIQDFGGLVLGLYLCKACMRLRIITLAMILELRTGASNLWFVSALVSRIEFRVCKVFFFETSGQTASFEFGKR